MARPVSAGGAGEAERAMFANLANLVNADRNLVRLGRRLDATFLLAVGDDEWLIPVERGMIGAVSERSGPMDSWRFAIRIDRRAWERFREPVPRPGYHDIFAMAKAREAAVEGDLQPFMANLRYIKEVLDKARTCGGGPA